MLLLFSIFILFHQTKNVLPPNVSIVRATIFVSGLNNEKVKSFYLYYMLRYKVQKYKNNLHSCTRCMGGLLRMQCFDVLHLGMYSMGGLLYMHIGP